MVYLFMYTIYMNVQEISLKCLKGALLAIKLAVFPIDGGLSVQWVLELCLHNVFDVGLLLYFYDIVRQRGYLSRRTVTWSIFFDGLTPCAVSLWSSWWLYSHNRSTRGS